MKRTTSFVSCLVIYHLLLFFTVLPVSAANFEAVARSLIFANTPPLRDSQQCVTWDVTSDFRAFPNQENPSRDSCGSPNVWYYLGSSGVNRIPATYTVSGNFNHYQSGIEGFDAWTGNLFTPLVAKNTTNREIIPDYSNRIPPNILDVHPGPSNIAIVGWRSPISGNIVITGFVSDLDPGAGNGILWFIDKGAINLAHGAYPNGGSQAFKYGSGGYSLFSVPVSLGDFIYFIVDPNSDYSYDSTQLDIHISTLSGPLLPPQGTTITSHGTGTGGVPNVNWNDDLNLTTQGCPQGMASYQVVKDGAVVRNGGMIEGPVGTYTATIPKLYPTHGDARVVISILCPDASTTFTPFDIYIDPSGTVRTVAGNPVAGATVTLFRSDSSSGPFDPVPDGSAIMSPENRHNPDTTDAAGQFGWDVIAGYYMVRAAKAGCFSPADPSIAFVDSVILTVPPAVTDLDLRLSCLGFRMYLPIVVK